MHAFCCEQEHARDAHRAHPRTHTRARVRKASTQAQPHVRESTTRVSQVNILICAFLGGVTVMCVKGLSTALILTLKVPHSVQHTAYGTTRSAHPVPPHSMACLV